MNTCRWFAGKARLQEKFTIKCSMEIPIKDFIALLFIVEVRYGDGGTERYLLPISFIDSTHTQNVALKGIITLAYINEKRGLVIVCDIQRKIPAGIVFSINLSRKYFAN